MADGAEAVAERHPQDPAEDAAKPPALGGAEIVRRFVSQSPLARHLGIELAEIEADRARLRLPFAESVVTVGDVVHGGAISALVDTAATAAAWATDDVPDSLRGSTVGLTVDFLAAARGADLEATARVVRRGGSLCFCDVEVAEPGGGLVAKALVTYKLG